MIHAHLPKPCVAAVAALAVLLAACGGGGNDSSPASAVLPPLATAKSCNNITGQLDAVQTALTTQLRPAVAALPTVGDPAASATTALSQTLDAVDALSAALTTLARTQNPQAFTAQLSGAGDSILCSSATLSDALARLAAAQTAPIPGVVTVMQTLALVSARVADGLTGNVPGGDLQRLTSQLSTLAQQLAALPAQLPPSLNQPFLREVLALNGTAFAALALILEDVGALNGPKLGADVTALLTTLANGFALPLAGQLGVPASALSPVASQLGTAAQTVGGGLSAVASPTLQAVSAVLAGVNLTAVGTALGPFADLLDGALSSQPPAASAARVGQLTQALGGNGLLTLLNALLRAFGGNLPR